MQNKLILASIVLTAIGPLLPCTYAQDSPAGNSRGTANAPETSPADRRLGVVEVAEVQAGRSGTPQRVIRVKIDWQSAEKPCVTLLLILDERLSPEKVTPVGFEGRIETLVELGAKMAEHLDMPFVGGVNLEDGNSFDVLAWKTCLGTSAGCVAGFVRDKPSKRRIAAQASYFQLSRWAEKNGVLQLEPPSDYFTAPGRMVVELRDEGRVIWRQTIRYPGPEESLEAVADTVAPGDTIVVIGSPVPVGINEKTLTTVEAGTQLTALKVKGDWVWVTVEKDGRRISGWIEKSYVQPKEADDKPLHRSPGSEESLEAVADTIAPGDAIVVTGGPVPVGTNKRTLTTIEAGTELTALKVKGDWVWVTVEKDGGRISGWIQRSYVRPKEPDEKPSEEP